MPDGHVIQSLYKCMPSEDGSEGGQMSCGFSEGAFSPTGAV